MAQEKIIHITLESRVADSEDEMSGEEQENNDDTLVDALDDELRRYLLRPKRVDETVADVYLFWKSKRDMVTPKQAGMRFAACHASSANTERIFPALSRICVPTRNRLSIDSISNLLSIMLVNPLKTERREQLVRQSNEQTELEVTSEDQGGSSNEAPILDEQLMRDALELGERFDSIRSSDDFATFSSIIDYRIEYPQRARPSGGGERLSTSERTRRAIERMSARDYTESLDRD